jgi:hypothetical protein
VSAPKSYATIVLKSGASFDIDVSEISSRRNSLSGELTSLSWEHHDDAKRRLVTVDLSEVAAVTFTGGRR